MKFAPTLVLLATSLAGCIQTQEADLVVHNATIYTLDENFTTAQAMAIRDGRIIEVGAEREILNRYKAAEKYDARKMYVYPGFNDAHAHFVGYAEALANVDLMHTASPDEMAARIAAFAEKSEREWIVGRGWDQNLWPVKAFPDKGLLDSLFPDRPILVRRVDGHAALANSAALRKCGITATTAVPGGKVVLGEDGEPTGLLIDRAIDRVARFIPPISRRQLIAHLKEAEAACFAAGLTTVSDAGLSVDRVLLLDSLHRSGDLTIRVYAFLRPDTASLEFMRTQGTYRTDHLNVGAVKLYADGALGSRGALLKAPYADDTENTGLLLTPVDQIDTWAQHCLDYGYQLNTHCIGDSANALVLDCYARHLEGVNDMRWRIEHAQVVSPEDRGYFRDYAIIPSVQPTHATSDGPWAEERLGPSRIAHAYAFESLRQTLGILALGTDFPVEAIDPLATFSAAVFRNNHLAPMAEPFQLDEALSPESALRGMTIWPAIASFDEVQKGTLEEGKWADFVVLNRDLARIPFDEMDRVKVVGTWVSGRSTH